MLWVNEHNEKELVVTVYVYRLPDFLSQGLILVTVFKVQLRNVTSWLRIRIIDQEKSLQSNKQYFFYDV